MKTHRLLIAAALFLLVAFVLSNCGSPSPVPPTPPPPPPPRIPRRRLWCPRRR